MSDMYHIGVVGSHMLPLPNVQAGVSISPNRHTSVFTPIGGIPRVQTAPFNARTWQVSLSPWSPPGIVGLFRAMAAGMVSGARLWCPEAAQVNLLPHEIVDPGVPGSRLIPAGGNMAVEVANGVTVQTPLISRIDLSTTIYKPRDVRTFTVSAWVSSASASGAFLEVRDGATVLATLSKPAGAVGPTLVTATFTTGASVRELTVVSTSLEGALWAAPRLVAAASSDGYWTPGQGVPVVKVADPAAVLQSTANGVKSDYSLTLTEVVA